MVGRQRPEEVEIKGSSQREPDRTSGLPVAIGDLAAVDRFRGDTLAVFCWSDIRPLRGVAGYVDWRLCGALSQTIEGGLFGAATGEVMLMPLTGRLGRRRMFVFGLGASEPEGEASLRRVCRQAFDVLEGARAERVTFIAPRTLAEEGSEGAFLRALGAERSGRALLVERVLVQRVGD